MDCVDIVRQSELSGDRHIAIVGLFLRAFDASSYCVRGAMSGNYTGSVMYTRDLLKTQFLLNATSRQVVWLFLDQCWFEFVPIFHGLQGRLGAQG
jgi:hypothetical protein